MPIPREHLLATPEPIRITPEDRLYMSALNVVEDTIECMTEKVWLHHLSLTLSIPTWQSAILVKRLKNEKKIINFKNIGFRPLYLAVNKQYLGTSITTEEQYDYKFQGDST